MKTASNLIWLEPDCILGSGEKNEASQKKEPGNEDFFWCHVKEHDLYLAVNRKLKKRGKKTYEFQNENSNTEIRRTKQQPITAAKTKNKEERDRYNSILKGSITSLLW